MGNTWTVTTWVLNDWANKELGVQYHERIYHGGESFWVALYYFFKARETKSGCIKLEYRGAND